MTTDLAALSKSRQSVYGDWQPNMKGTSQQIDGLLTQYRSVRRGSGEMFSLPDWWTPLSMVAVKLNRIASGVYHKDNFDDLRVYLQFVEEMQRGTTEAASTGPARPTVATPVDDDRGRPGNTPVDDGVVRPERVYVAGPYSGPSPGCVEANVMRAFEIAEALAAKGHDVHCPHTATHQIAKLGQRIGRPLPYERWMRLDLGIIERWATALFLIAPSPGADRELELAKKLGLKIYTSIDQVPVVN